MKRIVIIGAGQAGVQAAATLRSEGFGGTLTLIGEEPYPPYQRPPLSKAYLAGDFARERLFLKPDSFYAETRCDLRLRTAATAIDRPSKTVRLSDGTALAYDRLLLTTGARVRKVPVPGADLPGVHYLRGIEDVDALRPNFRAGARLAVVGGGYIGLEVAAVAVKHGLEVTVVEAAARVMVRAASLQLSAFYEAEHRAHGVKFQLGAMAEAFEGTARVEAVRTNQGRVPADFVLAGIGIVPNCELAQEAGLACDNGIAVDEFAATSDPDIFAAGDCTCHPGFAGGRVRLESVQNAIDQAKHAALGMLGEPSAYREVPWFWSDQYDLKLQIAGLAQAGDVTVLRGDPQARKFSVFHLRDGVIAAVEAVNAPPDYIIGRKLIAARARVAPERLADPNVPVKSFI
ncbi:MAG TPA: FAD-dependent oxidoreductase [Micropepsaceae bacterium]|nr:FAD-dependent oxidoreductase [Micropepsaceae bacterium]